ncbi:MAG: RES family NAD+ phosphorylase [Steroidobacteraceae bacterium]|nr:RES family NAD+ phosphorylase [Steroidobacteraceae bacterium]MCW5572386.1 RES family NAD+ phosphorylase [Steroidobacteraceae bacterium]
MILWRLSGAAHARAFDGGYGLHYDGRWNSAGHAVTYCATSPSLCVLEKLAHVQDPELLPALVMVRYDVPNGLQAETVAFATLPDAWRLQESRTQQRGDEWHAALATPLLRVPSAIVPLRDSPDEIVLVNHRHPAAAAIRIASVEAFVLDTRLF